MAATKKIVHEVIVIGGGLMGSSAAWHLSREGKSVLLIEKQHKIYDRGSSKGEARIVRCSNIENDELWSYLHIRSIKEIEVLIGYLNAQGITLTIEDIYTTSPISYIAPLEELDQFLENLKKQKVDFEIARTPKEGKSKFEVSLKKNTFLQREYNLHSGTLNPKKLIQALHEAIHLKGNRLWYRTKVEQIQKEGEMYVLLVKGANAKEQKLYAKQVVSAVGPYTGTLLKDCAPYFDSKIHPKRVFLLFLKVKNEIYRKFSANQKLRLKNGFPVIDRSRNVRHEEFFAMIEQRDMQGNPIIKIGGHYHRSNVTDTDQTWRMKLTTDEIDWAQQKIIDYLKFLNLPIGSNQIEFVDEYSCIYSLTQTEVPYVTPIRNSDGSIDKNFTVIAGMSGVGAKGAMTYGLIAANVLTNNVQEDSFYETAVAKLGYERLGTKTL